MRSHILYILCCVLVLGVVIVGSFALTTVTIHSPLNESLVAGTIALIGQTDADAEYVVFMLFNTSDINILNVTANVTTSENSTLLNTTFDTTTLHDGSYYVTALADNTTTNVTNSTPIHITIDNTAPAISIISPSELFISASELLINVSVVELHPNTTLFSLYNATDTIVLSPSNPSGSYWNATWDTREGNWTLMVNATDSASNVNTTNTSFIIDYTPPVVTLHNESINTTQDIILLNWTAVDMWSPTMSCELLLNGVGFGANQTVINNTPTQLVTNASLDTGWYDTQVVCSDIAGNTGSSESIHIMVDNQPPAIDILEPLAGYYREDIALSANITDLSSIDSVWFNVSGDVDEVVFNTTQLNQTDTVWSTLLTVSVLSEGPYLFMVTANDTLGNINSTNMTFVVDTTPPVVTLHNESINTTQDILLLNWTAVDMWSPTMSCELLLNGVGFGANQTVINNTPTQLVTNASLDTGWYDTQVVCSDIAGNTGSSESIHIMVDNQPPAIDILEPLTGYYREDIALSANITDLSSIDSVWFNVSGDADEVVFNTTQLNQTDTVWSTLLTVSVLSEGPYLFMVTANDTLGNINSTNMTFVVDTTPPVVTLHTTPFNTSSNTPSINVSFVDNLSHTASCELLVDGIGYGITQTVNNSTATLFVANSSLADGNYSFAVDCVDLAGNIGSSESIMVTIDTNVPVITILEPNQTFFRDELIELRIHINHTDDIDTVVFNLTNSSDWTLIDPVFQFGDIWNASVNLSDFNEGVYHFFPVANDTFGKLSGEVNTSFIIDRTPPTITLLNNSFNSTSSRPAVWFTVSDALSPTLTCDLFVDDVISSSIIVNSSGVLQPDEDLYDAQYEMHIRCTDLSGNNNSTDPISITVNRPGFISHLDSPLNMSWFNSDINITLQAGGSPHSIEWRVENVTNTTDVFLPYTPLTNLTASSWNAFINISNLTDGLYGLRFNITDFDFAGINRSDDSFISYFFIDTIPPSITSLSCNDISAGQAPQCTCQASDESTLFNGSVTTSFSSVDTSSSGSRTITCTAVDLAGNVATAQTTFSVLPVAQQNPSPSSPSSPRASPSVSPSATQTLPSVPTPPRISLQVGRPASIVVSLGAIQQFIIGLSEHTLRVESIDMMQQQATIVIQSNPQTFTISLDAYQEVDITNNGVDDLVVHLTGLAHDRADITMWLLPPPEPVTQPTSSAQTTPQPRNDTTTLQDTIDVDQTDSQNITPFILFAVLLITVAGIVVVIIVLIRYKMNA